jgi:hypothetical protein
VWLFIGLLIYFCYGRTHARLALGKQSSAAEELGAEETV